MRYLAISNSEVIPITTDAIIDMEIIPLSTTIYSIDIQNKLVNTYQIITLSDYNAENIEIFSNLITLLADGGEE